MTARLLFRSAWIEARASGGDDTAAIQSAHNECSARGGGTVYLPDPVYQIAGASGGLELHSNAGIRGGSSRGTKLVQDGALIGQRPGVIMTPADETPIDDWCIENLEIVGINVDGSTDLPASCGIWINGGNRGTIRNVITHHHDGAGICISGGSMTNMKVENCESYANCIDGIEINQAAGKSLDYMTIANCSTHDNTLNGVEINGTGSPICRYLVINGLTTYNNGSCGLSSGGNSTPAMSHWVIGDVLAYDNDYGVSLTYVSHAVMTGIACFGNAHHGLHLEACSNITGSGINLYDNALRGLYMATACNDIDLTLTAHDNGSGGSSTMGAVDVSSSGGACGNIRLSGSMSDNSFVGLHMRGVVRGHVDILAVGNGENALFLEGCTEVDGTVTAFGNGASSYAVQLGSACLRCTLSVTLGGTPQAVGWAVADAASTGNVIVTLANACATPYINSGTATVALSVANILFETSRAAHSLCLIYTTLASPGSVSLNPALGAKQRVTLQANCSSLTVGSGYVNGSTDGDELTIEVVQDGSGGHSFSWPAGDYLVYAGGTPPTHTTTANMRDVLTFRWDAGRNRWFETSRSLALP